MNLACSIFGNFARPDRQGGFDGVAKLCEAPKSRRLLVFPKWVFPVLSLREMRQIAARKQEVFELCHGIPFLACQDWFTGC